jgi:peroxiredoxin/predicted negative regulator of RcsB-dependent stress response
VKKWLVLLLIGLILLTPHPLRLTSYSSPLTPYGISWAAEALRGLKVGDPAPNFDLRAIDGQEITLQDLKGKVGILAFWRREQKNSQEALRDLEKIYQELKDKEIMVLAINGDRAKDQEIKEVGVSYGLSYLLAGDEERNVYKDFGIIVLPSTIIIGPEGKLEYFTPIHPNNFFDRVRGGIRVLLGEITPDQLEAELYPKKLPERTEARKKAIKHLNLGRVILKSGSQERAIAEIEKSIQADPQFLDPHILLVRLFLKDKDITKASKELDQARQLAPDSKEVKLLEGIIFALRGEDAKALELLEEIVKLNPKPPAEAYYYIGKVYQNQNKIEQAMESYRKALENLLDRPP